MLPFESRRTFCQLSISLDQLLQENINKHYQHINEEPGTPRLFALSQSERPLNRVIVSIDFRLDLLCFIDRDELTLRSSMSRTSEGLW
ncbi:hypothetical protein CesoFtcFv8_021439 [Champsocephalus esox]|uniref:Uncharacterized protein n=1 Tax=Champsocephalus esox TaxID=159716 RepID=A0AAN8BCY0_9TELE|nr:hypothetical protein CesoFtcFv8_021439 [Champsocephalus esox]